MKKNNDSPLLESFESVYQDFIVVGTAPGKPIRVAVQGEQQTLGLLLANAMQKEDLARVVMIAVGLHIRFNGPVAQDVVAQIQALVNNVEKIDYLGL